MSEEMKCETIREKLIEIESHFNYDKRAYTKTQQFFNRLDCHFYGNPPHFFCQVCDHEGEDAQISEVTIGRGARRCPNCYMPTFHHKSFLLGREIARIETILARNSANWNTKKYMGEVLEYYGVKKVKNKYVQSSSP